MHIVVIGNLGASVAGVLGSRIRAGCLKGGGLRDPGDT